MDKFGAYISHLASLTEDKSIKSVDRQRLKGYILIFIFYLRSSFSFCRNNFCVFIAAAPVSATATPVSFAAAPVSFAAVPVSSLPCSSSSLLRSSSSLPCSSYILLQQLKSSSHKLSISGSRVISVSASRFAAIHDTKVSFF